MYLVLFSFLVCPTQSLTISSGLISCHSKQSCCLQNFNTSSLPPHSNTASWSEKPLPEPGKRKVFASRTWEMEGFFSLLLLFLHLLWKTMWPAFLQSWYWWQGFHSSKFHKATPQDRRVLGVGDGRLLLRWQLTWCLKRILTPHTPQASQLTSTVLITSSIWRFSLSLCVTQFLPRTVHRRLVKNNL